MPRNFTTGTSWETGNIEITKNLKSKRNRSKKSRKTGKTKKVVGPNLHRIVVNGKIELFGNPTGPVKTVSINKNTSARAKMVAQRRMNHIRKNYKKVSA